MRRIAPAVVLFSLLAACTGGGGVGATEPESSTTTVASTAPTTSVPVGDVDPELGYRWVAGDCVVVPSLDQLPYEPFGNDGVVDCAQEHTIEVFATDTFADGPDAIFDDERVSATVRETCAEGFLDYVGTSQLTSGLDVVLYLPDAREWASGLRYMACVVYDPRSGSDAPSATGSFRDVGDAIPFAAVAGDCSNDLVMRGPLLDCALPHRYEHVGVFTPAATDWPGDAELADRATSGCRGLVDGYVVRGNASALGAVIGVPATIPTLADWEAGYRSVVCVGAAVDPAGDGLVVIGSYAQPGWTIVEATQAA